MYLNTRGTPRETPSVINSLSHWLITRSVGCEPGAAETAAGASTSPGRSLFGSASVIAHRVAVTLPRLTNQCRYVPLVSPRDGVRVDPWDTVEDVQHGYTVSHPSEHKF